MILFFLAQEKRKLTATELSDKLSAPINHLYKLVQILAEGGYLRTTQGKAGGIELNPAPVKISLLEIIELIDGPIQLSNCFFREENCSLVKSCQLKTKLREAQEKMAQVLKSSTVADLLESPPSPRLRRTGR